jgi:catechol 2,3-dioxygenase-like lactoylglutathione lyase family enzyme
VISRLDHAVLPVRDLDGALARWRDRLGFDARYGGRHAGGTHNGIVRFGTDYVELISVLDREAVLASGVADTAAVVDLLDRREGGMLGYIVATDDVEAAAERFRRLGLSEMVGPFAMERRRPDGRLLRWRLLSPRRQAWGTPWTMLIEWELPDAERLTWEEPGVHRNGARAIEAVAVAIGDLAAGARFYERELGLEPLERADEPELAARRLSYRVGGAGDGRSGARIDLLAPVGPGPIAAAVEAGQEHLWQLTIGVDDLAAARAFLTGRGVGTTAAPGTPGGLLIDPEEAIGARVVLVESSGEGGSGRG